MTANGLMKVEVDVQFERGRRGRKRATTDGEKCNAPPASRGRLPRVTKLMALAIRFERLVQTGEVASYAELARLGHVTRARMTQIMAFLHLAPDIQDALLNLPPVERGRDPITERDIRPMLAEVAWVRQRADWDSRSPDRRLCGLTRTGYYVRSASRVSGSPRPISSSAAP